MLQEAYREEIQNTVKEMLKDATEEQVALVTQEVLAHIDDDMELSIQEKVSAAFAAIGVISEEELDEITNN